MKALHDKIYMDGSIEAKIDYGGKKGGQRMNIVTWENGEISYFLERTHFKAIVKFLRCTSPEQSACTIRSFKNKLRVKKCHRATLIPTKIFLAQIFS